MRGTDPPGPLRGLGFWITPARAGNRDIREKDAIQRPDHPRACGEQQFYPLASFDKFGSPPRVRGTVLLCHSPNLPARITPARAGNSLFPTNLAVISPDHPRACGEQASPHSHTALISGSPPRVRGTAPGIVDHDAAQGITPARAGNRLPARIVGNIWQDHPRACGEQELIQMYVANLLGSPPRVRGTAGHPPWYGYAVRITPARAGNSPSVCPAHTGCWDHPRACGEQSGGRRRIVRQAGSPPRVRGTEGQGGHLRARHGITPARAGNRGSTQTSESGGGDHPRACGEQGNVYYRLENGEGSPPRVRGTGSCPYSLPACFGITPARAGNRETDEYRQAMGKDHPRACGEQTKKILLFSTFSFARSMEFI